MGLGKILKKEGFNLRERLNVYGGMALGALVPIAATRYFMSGSGFRSETALQEALYWGIASIVSIPITVYPMMTILAGATVGYFEAFRLRNKRQREKRVLT